MPKTKQISFQYSINENISLEVNCIAFLDGTDFVYEEVINLLKINDNTISKYIDFKTKIISHLYFPSPSITKNKDLENIRRILNHLPVKSDYISNLESISIEFDLKKPINIQSTFLNGQDIFPVLKELNATEKIYNEAIKQCWKEFNK